MSQEPKQPGVFAEFSGCSWLIVAIAFVLVMTCPPAGLFVFPMVALARAIGNRR